jgi:hypothetical protein
MLFASGIAGRALAGVPPAPWSAKSIGPILAPGFVDVDARGFWTVRAHNGDVGLSADSLFFIRQPLSGDGSILAFVLGEEGGNLEWGKAGLMVRENDNAGAANVHLNMTSGHGLGVTYRAFARQMTIDEGADRRYGRRQFPVWLRLQREGDSFTPFSSADGFGWTQLHSPIVLPGFAKDALFGVTASSVFDAPVAAAFSNITVAPGQSSPIVGVCSGNGSVLLNWPPVSGAVGYRVRRSLPATPAFAADVLTPVPIKETSFADKSLPNGQPLRYLVSALFTQDGQAVEGWATSVTTTPTETPGNLISCDLNLESTQLRTVFLYDSSIGAYRMTAAGGAIGDTEDHAGFAFQLVKGDTQVTTRMMDRPSRTGAGSKAGLMIRESLDGPARMAMLAGTGQTGVVFTYREETGGAAALSGRPLVANIDFQPPLYLRLVRKGNTITPYISADGVTFSAAGASKTFNPPLPETLYIGYAVTAGNAGTTSTSTFSNLTFSAPTAP